LVAFMGASVFNECTLCVLTFACVFLGEMNYVEFLILSYMMRIYFSGADDRVPSGFAGFRQRIRNTL
jgi:hypothetical protein